MLSFLIYSLNAVVQSNSELVLIPISEFFKLNLFMIVIVSNVKRLLGACILWIVSFPMMNSFILSKFTTANTVRSSRLNFSASINSGGDWYKDGLSFKCTMCGNCCSGSSGSILFTDLEAENMANFLNVSKAEFYKKFTRKQGRGDDAYHELKEKKSPHGLDCIFLDRKSLPGKAICSLYSHRPLQCKTWPFWPQNLESRDAWEEAKGGKEGCPGIDVGERIPYEDIVLQRDSSWDLI